jgi:hypothetical protein
VLSTLFLNEGTRSCGCLHDEAIQDHVVTHGLSKHRVYAVYMKMLDRCYDLEDGKYPDYGGRGIQVCTQWRGSGGFEQFIRDMGLPPGDGYQIDRKDNSGNYEPGNCRWATATEQARNRRSNRWVKYGGQMWVLAELAELLGLNYKRLHRQLQKCGDIETAVSRVRGDSGPVASRFGEGR